MRVGDKIIVHENLHTVIEEIVGDKIWFKDEKGKKWYVDKENDFKLI